MSGKPFKIAVQLSRVLGTLTLLAGVALLMLVGLSTSGALEVTSYRAFLAATFVVYLGPGAAILFVSFPLERRRHWALVAMLTIVGLSMLLMLLVIALALRSGPRGQQNLLFVAMPAVLCALGMATTTYLARSLRFLRNSARQSQAGFQPVFPPG